MYLLWFSLMAAALTPLHFKSKWKVILRKVECIKKGLSDA